MYRNILVPLDGSMFGEHALPLALSIARRAGGNIRMVHVHPVLDATMYAPALSDEALDERLREGEKSYLNGVAQRLAKFITVPVSSTLLEGPDIAASLCASARSDTDIIVMTTHGRGALGRFWLGSVADRLVRHVPVPMLLVRPQDGAPDFGREHVLKHMLLPLDGSAFTEQILEPAIALGSLMDADYTLLRTLKPIWPVDFDFYGGKMYGASMVDEARTLQEKAEKALTELRTQAEDYLSQVAQRLRARSLRVQTRVEMADQPAVAILQDGRPPAIDAIALETHGRHGLSRLFLGSVADKVIRAATVPILLHRPPEEPRQSAHLPA